MRGCADPVPLPLQVRPLVRGRRGGGVKTGLCKYEMYNVYCECFEACLFSLLPVNNGGPTQGCQSIIFFVNKGILTQGCQIILYLYPINNGFLTQGCNYPLPIPYKQRYPNPGLPDYPLPIPYKQWYPNPGLPDYPFAYTL